jgi:hypothetical protein
VPHWRRCRLRRILLDRPPLDDLSLGQRDEIDTLTRQMSTPLDAAFNVEAYRSLSAEVCKLVERDKLRLW